MPAFHGNDVQIFNARCPKCARFVKVQGILYEPFADRIVEVLASCKRDGLVKPTDYAVWP